MCVDKSYFEQKSSIKGVKFAGKPHSKRFALNLCSIMSLLTSFCFLVVCAVAVIGEDAGFVSDIAFLRQYPLLGLGGNKPFCVGVLLSPNFVLSPAHCLCGNVVLQILAGLPLTVNLLGPSEYVSHFFKLYLSTSFAKASALASRRKKYTFIMLQN